MWKYLLCLVIHTSFIYTIFLSAIAPNIFFMILFSFCNSLQWKHFNRLYVQTKSNKSLFTLWLSNFGFRRRNTQCNYNIIAALKWLLHLHWTLPYYMLHYTVIIKMKMKLWSNILIISSNVWVLRSKPHL